MAYKVIRPATHEEWLEERKKGIGSSEAGTVMGVNHFDTAHRLWRRKTGLDPAVESSEAMELGHHIEPAVASLFAARTGAEILKSSEGDWLAVDTRRDYLRVSPDRLYYMPGEPHTKGNQHILECKTTSVGVDKDSIPVYWYCQLQYQMGVMGIRKGALAWISSFPRLHFDFLEVEFNELFYESLLETLDTFWNVNILQNVAPQDQNGEDALLRYPKAEDGLTVEADAETIGKYNAIKQLARDIAELEKSKDGLEGEIKSVMGEAECLVMPSGTVIAQWKNMKPRMKFNEKSFQKDNPEEYDKYLEEVPGGRRFSIK